MDFHFAMDHSSPPPSYRATDPQTDTDSQVLHSNNHPRPKCEPTIPDMAQPAINRAHRRPNVPNPEEAAEGQNAEALDRNAHDNGSPESDDDNLHGFGQDFCAALTEDGLTLTMYAFVLAVGIFVVAVGSVGLSTPARLCKAPELVRYYNALPATTITAIPSVCVALLLASLRRTRNGVKRPIRRYFERSSRRYALIFFCLALTFITSPWSTNLANNVHLNCNDYAFVAR